MTLLAGMGYLSIKDRNTVKPLACLVLPKGRKICKPVASKVADYCALAVSCEFTSLTHKTRPRISPPHKL